MADKRDISLKNGKDEKKSVNKKGKNIHNIYQEAAGILKDVKCSEQKAKHLISEKRKKNTRLVELVCGSAKFWDITNKVVVNTKLLKQAVFLRKNKPLGQVLVYDLMFGEGLAKSKYQKLLQPFAHGIKGEIEKLKIKAGVTKKEDLAITQMLSVLPCYVRVNLIKTTLENIVAFFKRAQFTEIRDITNDNFFESVGTLKDKSFFLDPHVPNLMVLPTSTDLTNNPMYRNGQIIVQDKSSCIAVHVLDPHPSSDVIDTCGAPGEKAVHIAAMMKNKGRIFTFEKDLESVIHMNPLLVKSGVAGIVKVQNMDFLSVDVNDSTYASVQYVLVTPNCSSTGKPGKSTQTLNDERLQKLSRYQISMLKRALSLPSVKRVVYTTSSQYPEENEQVVEEVFNEMKNEFKLINAMPECEERGLDDYRCGSYCARFNQSKNFTRTLFLACFERVKEDNIARDQGNGNKNSTKNEKRKVEDIDCVTPAKKTKHSDEVIKVLTPSAQNTSETSGNKSNTPHSDKKKKKKKRKSLPLTG